MLTLLTVVLLAVHLLAMNVAAAGPLVCLWLHGQGRRGEETAFAVGRQLAWLAAVVLLAGGVVGGVLVAFAAADPDGRYLRALERFPPQSLIYAGGEAVFSLACLVVYAGMWDRWRGRPWLHGLWAVLAATNLLYHFPPLMVALGTLAVNPQLVSEPVITRGVFRPLMVSPEILSQSVHFALASVAVAGLTVMLLARRLRRSGENVAADVDSAIDAPTEEAGRLIRGGALIALTATATQLIVGTWVLVELPYRVRHALVGDDWLATGLFLLAIVGTFGLLNSLAIVGLGDTTDRSVQRCAVLLLSVVLLMAGVLQISRETQVKTVVRRGWTIEEPTRLVIDK
jgi:hypothetical protein